MDEKLSKYNNYITGKYPNIEVSTIQTNLTDGLHNDIVIINGNEVFRFAKNDFSKELLLNEFRVIQIIKQYVEMPVPNLEIIDDGVSKYSLIKGNPIFRSNLMTLHVDHFNVFAEQIGRFLSQLHSIPLGEIQEHDISAFPGNGTRDSYLELYSRIEEKLFPHMKSYVVEHINHIFKPLFINKKFLDYDPVLIHGDLAPYHILEASNKVVGIIDFGVSGTGDPAHDVGVILDTLGEEIANRISHYYEGINTFIDRSRFYANVSSIRWALIGYESNDVSWHLNHFFTAKEINPYR